MTNNGLVYRLYIENYLRPASINARKIFIRKREECCAKITYTLKLITFLSSLLSVKRRILGNFINRNFKHLMTEIFEYYYPSLVDRQSKAYANSRTIHYYCVDRKLFYHAILFSKYFGDNNYDPYDKMIFYTQKEIYHNVYFDLGDYFCKLVDYVETKERLNRCYDEYYVKVKYDSIISNISTLFQ